MTELAAIREWGVIPQADRFAMLSQIHHPTLIAHGSKFVVVMLINAFLLAEHRPDAKLIIEPDASHGAQSLKHYNGRRSSPCRIEPSP